jgi:hypothetical protein
MAIQIDEAHLVPVPGLNQAGHLPGSNHTSNSLAVDGRSFRISSAMISA